MDKSTKRALEEGRFCSNSKCHRLINKVNWVVGHRYCEECRAKMDRRNNHNGNDINMYQGIGMGAPPYNDGDNFG